MRGSTCCLRLTLICSALASASALAAGERGNKPPMTASGEYAGEIRIFAAENCPANWLQAKGQSLEIRKHQKLFDAIGTLWGSSSTGHFNLPDLRGQFVRGWDANSGIDPEATLRTLPPGAPVSNTAKGDQVGSQQPESVAAHSHDLAAPGHWGDKYGSTAGWSRDNGVLEATTVATSAVGGKETRPKNVAVLFCIRI